MKLYNSLTRQKEDFIPIKEGEVTIYACGPTVYNFFHIGNARPFIVFDTLRRYFEYSGYRVTFVQNFTDIDDKMINRASEEGITVKELADRFIKEYFIDADGLGIRRADIHPKATEHIGEIIKTIKKLIDSGHAYESNGDVYFKTRSFSEYGKLSGQSVEDLESGARIDVSEIKEDPLDFALWKASKEGEPFWKSPWGEGRPGWHIECSAMATKYLGETIDIHGGGQDLIFPHHENEIAQSECANGCTFARYWLHNGYINVDNQKMSKSLGNFFTVRDVAGVFDYEVVRFFMLSAHYRSPINYAKDILDQAETGLGRIYTCRDKLYFLKDSAKDGAASERIEAAVNLAKQAFKEAMDDDLNTASAISSVFDLVREINTLSTAAPFTSGDIECALSGILELTSVLNILSRPYERAVPKEVLELLDERNKARSEKNFQKSDEIRDRLKEMGYAIEDTKLGARAVKI